MRREMLFPEWKVEKTEGTYGQPYVVLKLVVPNSKFGTIEAQLDTNEAAAIAKALTRAAT